MVVPGTMALMLSSLSVAKAGAAAKNPPGPSTSSAPKSPIPSGTHSATPAATAAARFHTRFVILATLLLAVSAPSLGRYSAPGTRRTADLAPAQTAPLAQTRTADLAGVCSTSLHRPGPPQA